MLEPATSSRFWLLAVALSVFQFACLLYQAIYNAPTSDESAHLASSVATYRNFEPGYYRVNPPLMRFITGFAVDLVSATELPSVPAPSNLPPGVRWEFRLATEYHYRNNIDVPLFVGRLIRIAMVVLTGWWVYWTLRFKSEGLAIVAHLQWCTNPLLLGHGWLLMNDGPAACASAWILIALISRGSRCPSVWGLPVCWGIAFLIKFTFWPLFALHLIFVGLSNAWQESFKRIVLSCVVVWGIVCLGYLGSDIGVPFPKHEFQSRLLSRLNHWNLPSPLPKQAMVGLDEQTLDLERGLPTYVLGKWYEDGVWWYYLFGLVAKSSVCQVLLLIVATAMAIVAIVRMKSELAVFLRKYGKELGFAQCVFAAAFTVCSLALLSMNYRLALNVRYVTPMLPFLFLLSALPIASWLSVSRSRYRVCSFVCLAFVAEMCFCFPYYFSYNNLVTGGSYRIPPALHDSNLDGGQDAWYARLYAKQMQERGERVMLLIDTRIPETRYDAPGIQPTTSRVRRCINWLASDAREESRAGILIVSKGLMAKTPWAQVNGMTTLSLVEAASELANLKPHAQLTPVLMVYRVPLRLLDDALGD